MYALVLQEEFESCKHLNPKIELVALKQTSIVDQYHDHFMSLLNQLHFPESYAISIFLYNLKLDIGQYLRLFKSTSLIEGFTLAQQIEDIAGMGSNKNIPLGGAYLPKPLFTVVKWYLHIGSSTSPNGHNTAKNPIKVFSQSEMDDGKKNGLCFWCASKYTSGHKCHKSQFY